MDPKLGGAEAGSPEPDGSEAPLPELDATVAELYQGLRRMAQGFVRRERRDLTLSATELVHEAYRRLAGNERLKWRDERHFLGIAAIAMRRLLVEHARSRARLKRGDAWRKVTFDGELMGGPEQILDSDDLLALDTTALKHLAEIDSRQARVVEMRFFAGMSLTDVGRVLGVNRRTVDRDWAHAKHWLKRQLAGTRRSAPV